MTKEGKKRGGANPRPRSARHAPSSLAAKPAATPPKPPAPLQEILHILHSRTGHDFSLYKKTSIRRRLEKRMRTLQLTDLAEYARHLRDNADEAEPLFKDLLISVTSFFRDPAAFEALKEKLMPKLLRESPGSYTLRVWVPGCANGCEAYSIAMLLQEIMADTGRFFTVLIFATDIDPNAVAMARAGLYPPAIAEAISPQRLERFFTREDGSFRVVKTIREMLVFTTHDIIKDPPFINLDLLCCRNLLIYFEKDLQKKLLPTFHYSLKPDGLLFLGTSENIAHFDENFALLDSQWKIFRRKSTKPTFPTWPRATSSSLASVTPLARAEKTSGKTTKKKNRPASNEAARLEQELQRTREQLLATIEELQSTNEELESANEEMTTSKEELQSLNEEALTVNVELQNRIEELRKANDDLKNLLDSARIATVFLDKEFRVRFFTPPTTAIIPLTPTDIGRSLSHFSHSLLDVDLTAVAAGALRDKEPHRREVASRDGLFFLMGTHLYRTTGGVVDGVVLTFLDITERKRAEEETSRAREQWERTFAGLGDLATIQDTKMRIVRANLAACQAFDSTEENLRGRHCYELFRGMATPCPDCPITVSLQDMAVHSAEIESANLGKTFLVTASPICDEQGKITHIAHIARDITDQKRMESQLRQAQKMEAIGSLAGGIAHDFNNILMPIFGYADLIKNALPTDSPLQEDIAAVISAGSRARELVQQILSFSRQTERKRVPTRLHIVVKEVLRLLRSSLPSTIDIQPDISPESGMALADPIQIHQILMNLGLNAAYAMHDTGGILRISLADVELGLGDPRKAEGMKPGGYLHLQVSDTGCGMDKATLEKIFEPYFTTKPEGEGTGFGLAVVHGIVTSHEGHIEVNSEPGIGTTFDIFLPLLRSGRESVTKEPKGQPIPTGSERILVVDDDEEIVRMLQHLLTVLGYRVTHFVSSPQALQAFLKNPKEFDLVITDLTMPGLTGRELAQELLATRPGLPIILCTGYHAEISRKQAMALGIRELVMKPFTMEEIATTVRKVLEDRKPPATGKDREN